MKWKLSNASKDINKLNRCVRSAFSCFFSIKWAKSPFIFFVEVWKTFLWELLQEWSEVRWCTLYTCRQVEYLCRPEWISLCIVRKECCFPLQPDMFFYANVFCETFSSVLFSIIFLAGASLENCKEILVTGRWKLLKLTFIIVINCF